jgi:hypothetical protein
MTSLHNSILENILIIGEALLIEIRSTFGIRLLLSTAELTEGGLKSEL